VGLVFCQSAHEKHKTEMKLDVLHVRTFQHQYMSSSSGGAWSRWGRYPTLLLSAAALASKEAADAAADAAAGVDWALEFGIDAWYTLAMTL
jgi:hypothetical protein